METLIWMSSLGVMVFMVLFWTARALYRKFTDWRLKAKSKQGRKNCPGPSVPGTIDPQTPRGVNPRGQHIFAGVVSGAVTYMALGLIVDLLTDGRVVGNALRLAALVVAVWAGVRIYRLLQRRWVKEEAEAESRAGQGSA